MAFPMITPVSPNGTRTGYIALQDISEGSLILEATKPALAIACGDARLAKAVCYHCFACISPTDGIFSIPGPHSPEPLIECACGVVAYCSQRCQRQCWEGIHKVECEAFKELAVAGNEKYDVYAFRFRALLRLLLGFEGGRFSRWELETFCRFDPMCLEEEFRKGLVKEAVWLRGVTKSSLGVEMIADLVFAVHRDLMPIYQPVIRVSTHDIHVEHSTTVAMGQFIEPYLYKLSHSCAPNSWVIFEGSSLRLRAMCPIKQGEEITISYVPWLLDPQERRDVLNGKFGIDCKCTLCLNPVQRPENITRKNFLQLTKMPPKEHEKRIGALESVIEDLKEDDMDYGNMIMHTAHEILMPAYTADFNYAAAFKLCIKIFFVIEPAILARGKETLPLMVRVGSLYRLCSFFEYDNSKPKMDVIPVPEEIRKMDPVFKLQLRWKYVLMKEKCLGCDAVVVVAEMEEMKVLIEEYKVEYLKGTFGVRGRWWKGEYERGEKERFDKSVKVLLDWAGCGDVVATLSDD